MSKRRTAGAPGPAKPGDGYKPRKEIQLKTGPTDEDMGRAVGELMTGSELAAWRVINHANPVGPIGKMIDVPALLDTLRDQAAAVNAGDLSRCEAMLMNQAVALQSLFARLTERGMSTDSLASFEAHMRVALRAQNQSRSALETLAQIKNPPVFTRQANIAQNQQINVGATSRAGEDETAQNKQSKAGRELLQDTRASSAAIGGDPALATVGEVHRAEVGGG